MKRLIRKAQHDIGNREFAILYIDGQLIEAHTHKEAIDIFLASKQEKTLDGDYEDYIWDDFEQYSDKLAFLHYAKDRRVDENGDITNSDAIFLNSINTVGVDNNEVIQAIQSKYPGIPIYEDEDYQNVGNNLLQYEKIAKRLIKNRSLLTK